MEDWGMVADRAETHRRDMGAAYQAFRTKKSPMCVSGDPAVLVAQGRTAAATEPRDTVPGTALVAAISRQRVILFLDTAFPRVSSE